MPKYLKLSITACLLLLLSSCATLSPNFDKPALNITRISMVPTGNLEARFKIGVRLTNPNALPLPLSGMSFDVALQGFNVISGVTSNLSTLPAYGEKEFEVEASTNLIQSFRLFNQFLNKPMDALDYTFKAKLDLGNTLVPALRLSDSGKIDLAVLQPRAR